MPKRLRELLQSARFWELLSAIIALLAAGIFVYNIVHLYEGGRLYPSHRHQAPSPEEIRGWMTFRYINHVFKLPPDYLQNELHIATSTYLNISIEQFAHVTQASSAATLEHVRNSVYLFYKNSPPRP